MHGGAVAEIAEERSASRGPDVAARGTDGGARVSSLEGDPCLHAPLCSSRTGT